MYVHNYLQQSENKSDADLSEMLSGKKKQFLLDHFNMFTKELCTLEVSTQLQ